MTNSSQHTRYLLLDAAGRQPLCGVWTREGSGCRWLSFVKSDVPATESLFALAGDALERAGTSLNALDGFLFASGPGSTLGIRIAAAALRAWKTLPALAGKKIFSFNSLSLAARLLLRASPTQRTFTLFADSRQNRWNALLVTAGSVAETFIELDAAALAAAPAPRFRIVQRATAVPPCEHVLLPPNLLKNDPSIFAVDTGDALTGNALLSETVAPDAVNLVSEYTRWTPSRHRAGGAKNN